MPLMKMLSQVLLAAVLALFVGHEAFAQQKPNQTGLPDTPAPKQSRESTSQNQAKSILATPLGLITRKSY
ncbi:MAG: hypothetical protein WA647_18960, partial [Candidatus Acidiferrum sp.]